MTRVLVAYASKYGSVEEVARTIGAVLRDEGADCDVVAAPAARSLQDYDLVVLGTGLYVGRIHRDARRFLKQHDEELELVPYAVFGMGPLSDDPAELEKVRPQLERALERHVDARPVASEIFGGVIEPGKLSFPFNHLPAGDHRDWEAIARFARSLPALVSVATERAEVAQTA